MSPLQGRWTGTPGGAIHGGVKADCIGLGGQSSCNFEMPVSLAEPLINPLPTRLPEGELNGTVDNGTKESHSCIS